MMKYSYYPGCSLTGTAYEFDLSTREVCRRLGVDLEELNDWNCCGSTSSHSTNPDLAIALSSRNLAIAEKTGHDVVVPCSACFFQLRAAAKYQKEGHQPEGAPKLEGSVDVKNLLDVLADEEMVNKLAKEVRSELKGLRVACYYGCLSVRNPEITGHPHPENPTTMETILEKLGVETVDWPYKTQCCGGGMAVSREDLVTGFVSDIFSMAHRVKVDALVTGCPMCFMNLDSQSGKLANTLPVFYFTELMMLALDKGSVQKCLKGHLTNTTDLLTAKGLL